MKKKFLPLMTLALTGFATDSLAQKVTVSPLPQEITWGETKAFDKGFKYTLKGDKEADQDAIAALKEGIRNGSGSSVEIVIGEKEDAAVAAYKDKIPNKKDGYYLEITPNKVVIAGNDNVGTFYGVQTFLQIASQNEIMQATVTDYPDVLDRGVIEGFYGNYWSQTDRIRQFQFYGKNKMNVYIYAPKDDPYHRGKWREPYPEKEAAQLKELLKEAHKNKVQFVWSIHPGNDIKWNDTDRNNVIKKLELMYDMGVRAFGMLFDDIGGEGTNPEKQAELINYVTEHFIKKHPGLPPLIFCPTQYNKGWSSGNYLDVLGNEADKDVRIMWTGNSVVSMIDKGTMDWINNRIKRNAYIWLNYPVTDYCIDRMLMGPTYGNGKDIAQQLSGFTANPMEYAEASKVSLYSIADYTWNMTDYDENASWERAIKYLMPEHDKAFHVFCENNIDLGSTAHGLRRKDESKRFKEAIDKFKEATSKGFTQEAFSDIKPMFDEFVTSCDELLALTEDPLIKEITPWLKVMKLMGQRGQNLCQLYATIENKQPEKFLELYKAMKDMEAEQKQVISRPGTIKSPNPTVAAEVVAPFMREYTGKMIGEYKKHFKEGWENFPVVLLNDGKYYIKYKGKYLTNRGGSNPVFESKFDDINPQRQEWLITMDYNTNRYKLVNAQDNRYVNENGDFTRNNETNPYESVWHSYNITRFNGHYSIQNAGSAGNKFWQSNGTRISQSGNNQANNDVFIFEIIPTSEDERKEHPVIEANKTYYIISPENTYLTNVNPGANRTGDRPVFKEKYVKDSQKKQAWTINLDTKTKRFNIKSAADKRYVNEKGTFAPNLNLNPYDATWHTYILTEMDSLYAIQNAGEAGHKYWTISGTNIQEGSTSANESFLFKIVETEYTPTGIENSLADEAQKDDTIYDLSGRVVLHPTKGVYICNGKKFVVSH